MSHLVQITSTLEDDRLQQALYAATGRLVENRRGAVAADQLPDYQAMRRRANEIKRHTIENLDHYLETLETNVTARGGNVVYARDGAEAADFVVNLARRKNAKSLVKSKSMATEEARLNDRLEEHGFEAIETDLGEFIIQLSRERPYHIIGPSIHKTRADVADLFEHKLGARRETVPEKQTLMAREFLRQKFLEADIGVSGGNFLVADSGAIVLVENEGNARLSTTLPRIHVAIVGIEKILPRAADLPLFLRLLGRSATGQSLTAYTSFLSGPRRPGEIDGPEEFYLVLLDNGRSRVLSDPAKRETLFCIRCGACLNICPVYRKIGGHSYPWVYSGPIGAILTPQIRSEPSDRWLPFASSLCGACGEVCPVKIEIPRLLLELRSESIATDRAAQGRIQGWTFRIYAWMLSRPRAYRRLMKFIRWSAPRALRSGGWLRRAPSGLNTGPVRDWLTYRDMPALAPKSFLEMWEERRR